MAFAGIAAADANGRIPVASILPAGAYRDQVGGAGSGAIFVKTTAGSSRPGGSENRSRLNRIAVVGATLADWQASPADVSKTDAGAFFSASGTVANSHGLPANFGPGQGNWVADDVAALDVFVRQTGVDADGADPNVMIAFVVAAGNITITFHNTATDAADLLAATIVLHYHPPDEA